MNRHDWIGNLTLFLVIAALAWAFAPTMAIVAERWNHTPEYSHGWVIPIFCVWAVWSRFGESVSWPRTRSDWIGWLSLACGLFLVVTAEQTAAAGFTMVLGLAAAGVGAAILCRKTVGSPQSPSRAAMILGGMFVILGLLSHLAGGYFFVDWLTAAAIIPILYGIVTLFSGQLPSWRVTGILAFLVFMIPLPFSLEVALREPLRKLATVVSTYLLQVMGFPCIAEGYVILIGESRIGVTEACSGLSMLMVFAALTFGLVMVVQRPIWQKLILALSWPVIAIAANVFRIVVTGGLYALGHEKLADMTYHDLAGLAMMPVGMVLLWLEMTYLDHLIVKEYKDRLNPVVSGLPEAARP